MSQSGLPGQSAAVETSEANIFWGGDESRIEVLRKSAVISSAAVDAGNTPTTVLRPGLILGKITASSKLVQYDNGAADGSEVAYAVLDREVDMLDENNAAADQFSPVIVKAPVRIEALLIEGLAFDGHADEAATRVDLNAKNFALNDEY